MKRRLISMMLILIMVLSLLPVPALAAVYSGTCGTNGSNVRWSLNTVTGELIISGSGDMDDFSDSHPYSDWYYYEEYIKTVTIKNGVTSIGGYAFYMCFSLTSLTIPNSVTSIGHFAFYDCRALTSVDIPDSVTSIGSGAFDRCYSLTSVTLGTGVTSINDRTFAYCGSLSSIYVSDDNTAYKSLDGVLYTKDGKELVKYPVAKTDTSFLIPNGVTSIGGYAFYSCDSLSSVTIPDSVTSIGRYAFEHCRALTLVTIPDSVTSIGKEAFYGCASLTSVTIGEGVTSIGYGVFVGCDSLTSVTIPDSVTSIGSSAFYSCDSLTSVTIGNGVTSIGKEAFYGCSSLTSVMVPNSVTSIGDSVFYNCSSLVSIEIPDSVTSGIGDSAFYNCTSLTSVELGDSVVSIGNSAFYNCSSLTSIEIPDSVTSIGSSAFYSCDSLTSVTIGNGVTSIGKEAFYGCSSLTSVIIPDSVTSIGQSAFEGCSSLTWVEMGNNVTSVGWYAFDDCTSLTTVYTKDLSAWCGISFGLFASTPMAYADKLYLNGTLIKDLVIPAGVTRIGYVAFLNCSSLTSVTIPDSVTSIDDGAFYGCTSLTSVTIGEGVTSIGEEAFYGCSSLTVHCFDTEKQWSEIIEDYNDSPLRSARWHYVIAGYAKYVNNNDGTHTTEAVCSVDDCNEVFARQTNCTAIAGKTVYSIAKNKTHVKTDVCICDAELTKAESCTDVDKNNICDLCGSVQNCRHNGQAEIYYMPNEDGETHKVTIDCVLCRETMYTKQEKEKCTEEDDICILCGQNLSCRHLETESRTVYVDNEDRSHKVFYCEVCVECDDEVSRSVPIEAEPCTDENDDDLCDRCEADLYCDHTNGSKLIYTPNGDRATHAVTLNCTVCMEVLNDVTPEEACTFSDGICTKCGMDITVISGTCGDGLTWELNTKSGILTVLGSGAMENYTRTETAPWFQYCDDIKAAEISSGATNVGAYAFYNCTALTEVMIPDSVTILGSGAFRGCSSLTEIEIPDSVTFMGSYLFRDCVSLKTAAVPDGITSLEYSVFGYCSSLTDVVIPDTVTNIGSTVFRGCCALRAVDIPDGVTAIGTYAFYDCTTLTSIEIPLGVETIEAFAFGNCTGLTEVVVPGNVTVIGGSAFNGCTGLRSLEMPNTVTNIGINALKDCTNLSEVYYVGTKDKAADIIVGSGNDLLVNAQWHYILSGSRANGDLTHSTGDICTECGVSLGEVLTAACIDADKDLRCDQCEGSMRIKVETFAVSGVNMTLGNELELNIMLPKSSVDAYGRELTATVTHHAVSGDVVYTWTVSDLPEYAGGKYYKASVRVAAAQMTDLVDIVVTDEYGNIYNNDYVTSVRTYVTNNLDKQTNKVKTLLVDMVNYGAAAQDQFQYRQNDYANANLTEAQKLLATPNVECTDIRVKGTNYIGSNLSLQDRILLNFFFSKVDDAVMAEMYATVEFTGAMGDTVKDTVKVEKMSGYAGVAVDQIVLADSGCPVTVTLYNADGSVYGYATDSVESYNARQNPNGTNALYTNIMKFAIAACDYFGCMPGAETANVFVYEEVTEVVLADGTVLQGEAYRALGEVEGIVVYETAPESIPLMRCSFVRKVGETADGTVVYKTVGEVTDLPGSYCDYDYGAIGWPELSEVTVFYEYDSETYDDDSGTYSPALTAYSSWEDILCKHEFTAALYWKPEDEDYVIVWITDWYDEDWDQIIL